jgi:hypothetical protein
VSLPERLRLVGPYALRGVRRHPGPTALLAAAVAAAVALATLLLAAVGTGAGAFLARVQPVPLPGPAVAYYPAGGTGYAAAELPTTLGERLVVAGLPVPANPPAPGQVLAPAWLAAAAGLQPGDTVVLGRTRARLGGTYAAAWDRSLPLLVVAAGTLPLSGKLYVGEGPPPGAAWVLGPGSGRDVARRELAGVDRPTRLLLALVAALGGLGAANALLLGLLRRRRQFGVARALGCEEADVAAWLLVEAGAVAAVGVGVGWALAAAAIALLPRWQGPVLRLSAGEAMAAAAAVTAALVLAARWPLRWLRGMTVAELLRDG